MLQQINSSIWFSMVWVGFYFRIWLAIFLSSEESGAPKYLLPVDVADRSVVSQIQLTEIGEFGLWRKARPGIPAHFHTGIDIKRPINNYEYMPIYSIGNGLVISKRTDGPYAQVIIEHRFNELTVWSVYEHISDIQVELNQEVDYDTELARFFNKEELNKYGWQFDHFHFEILKSEPIQADPRAGQPDIHFKSHTLECYTEQDLLQHFHDPIFFFK